ncbi:MAG: agmatine deiminase family protein [Alphaproteobacteria bacterium]
MPVSTQFFMPPEWAKQKRIWLSWPHEKADWPGKFGPVPAVFAEIVRVIAMGQRVGLVVKDAKAKKEAQTLLVRSGVALKQVDFLVAPTNRGWLRDCGPIWVKGGKRTLALDWKFSAWAKYPNWRKDDALPQAVAKFSKHARIQPTHKNIPVVLEGGGIEVDGAGTILVTKEWLLSDTQVRNPGFTKTDYEQVFAKYLGATNTVWLNKGIVGDDTHGHVDDITRFVAPGKIVTAIERDKKDANYALLRENLKVLKAARDAKGQKFEIVALPMPRPVMFDGERLPASYANFLIANKSVLVPVFNDPADRVALGVLQECFPTREVVPVYARDLVWGLGTIHCLTQQEPA